MRNFIWLIVIWTFSFSKDKIVRGSDLVNVEAKWILISARSVSGESDPSTTSLLFSICVLVLLPAWTQTRSEVEISGGSSGKIFWSILTYVSLVTVTVMLVKCQGASQWDHWINSCWNSAGVIEEFSCRIRNCIVAWGRIFEKLIDRCNTILKSQLSAGFCLIYLPWVLKKL